MCIAMTVGAITSGDTPIIFLNLKQVTGPDLPNQKSVTGAALFERGIHGLLPASFT